jgi:hypothetical protein
MERVQVDERGLFDPSQGREAPASEASDSPRFGAMCSVRGFPLSKKEKR